MGVQNHRPAAQPEHEKMIEHMLMAQTGHDCLHC